LAEAPVAERELLSVGGLEQQIAVGIMAEGDRIEPYVARVAELTPDAYAGGQVFEAKKPLIIRSARPLSGGSMQGGGHATEPSAWRIAARPTSVTT
jgi:hypothetical protein